MLFNSAHFMVFLPIVLILAKILKGTYRRVFLLLASLYFYNAWHPKTIDCSEFRTGTWYEYWIDKSFCDFQINLYIIILIVSMIVDYFAALIMSREGASDKFRKLCLVASLLTNLGILAYFKYTNFILDVVSDIFFVGTLKIEHLKIILPVGISFYTFQSMSYTIDVYRRNLEARTSFLDFALYVSFFPQLVAGPIVRAHTFFRDLDHPPTVTAKDVEIAFAQILMGFTRKIVFADNLAKVVDTTFANYAILNPVEIWVGAMAFGWQIYFDFAGYTDIAIGVARLFGYKFDPNFNFPMVARNIADHWSRWHISFSTWIRDYIYIPLGGSRVSVLKGYRNLFITWLFAGVWHGAAYHFVGWGIWQGVMLGFHREYSKTRFAAWINEKGGRPYDIFARIVTMFFLSFGFIMFRAETMEKAWSMMKALVFWVPNGIQSVKSFSNYDYGILLAICFIASYYFSKNTIEDMVENGRKFALFFIVNFFLILFFGAGGNNFLYFDF
ncbi:MBOAT family protein [Leptospira wolffii]|uniref:MBOAT family O-acyltransferase n=1 Tax=Leptospira wolffii TaxID=409998 RepID=UPI00108303B7|nr:MBOAT family O-acyltransferase [Leptospira wolffii]TGK59415.1 MBOAT family protein [Leptospira wolffii]TGK71202.1 MBOAT family protein [Leptospira wolffii]TGK77770.1 MBOAT family protein [Leptospira wolffii]TGL29520.1 MBOAT family protein [Leptospira wolffii]